MSVSIRNHNIDLIKFVAMLAVIAAHTCYPGKYQLSGCSTLIYDASSPAILLFIMASGYLLLGRQDASYKYSLAKCMKIIRIVVIWTIILTLLTTITAELTGWHVNIKIVISQCFIDCTLGLLGLNRFYFWYFGAMIFIFLLYPLLNKVYNNPRQFKILILGLLILQTIIFTVQFILVLTDITTYPLEYYIPQSLRIWNWVFYFCLGGLFKKPDLIRLPTRLFSFLGLSICMIIAMGSLWMTQDFFHCPNFEFYYSSIFIILYTTSTFGYLLKVNIIYPKIIDNAAQLFLPVYLLQYWVIGLIENTVPIQSFGKLAPPVVWLMAVILTVTLSYILMKIPLVKKITHF